MCIGIPMQVVALEPDGAYGWCERPGADDGAPDRARLDLRLVGALPPGAWVLAFHGAARRVLDEVEAHQTLDALRALDAALTGQDNAAIDALFADLVEREPQLPAHLQAPARTTVTEEPR